MWKKTFTLMFNENIKLRRLLLNWNFKKIVDLFYYMILAEKKYYCHQVWLQFRISYEQWKLLIFSLRKP